MKPRFLPLTLTAWLLAPTSGSAQAAECAGPRPDSLATATPPIYRECDVTRKAELRGNPSRIDFRPGPTGGNLPRCLLATFSLVVDSAGRIEPGTLQVVSTNHPGYAGAVGKSLTGQRFRPAELEGKPVRQLAVIERTMPTVVRFRVGAAGGARRPMPIADPEPPDGGC